MKKQVLSLLLSALLLGSQALALDGNLTEQSSPGVVTSETVPAENPGTVPSEQEGDTSLPTGGTTTPEETEATSTEPEDKPSPVENAPKEENKETIDGEAEAVPSTETPDVPAASEEPEIPVFSDTAGHWAELALQQGVTLGFLKGSDGKMLPDQSVKLCEALVILNRVLTPHVAEESIPTSVPADAWYREELSKSVHLGLVRADDTRNFDAPATRAEAFVLFARAFGYTAQEDTALLAQFDDIASMTAEQKQAAAALVQAGVIQGVSDQKLAPRENLTRAQFVTILFRMVPQFPQDEEDLTGETGGAWIDLPAIDWSNVQLAGDRFFGCNTEQVQLSQVSSHDRLVFKGAESLTWNAEHANLVRLDVDPAGEANLKQKDGYLRTLGIAGSGGDVSYQGEVQHVWISASNRTITLTGIKALSLTISGSGNHVVIDGSVEHLEVTGTAKNTDITLQGTVDTLTLSGVNATVSGSGTVDQAEIRAKNCTVTLPVGTRTEEIDPGIVGISLQVQAAVDQVAPGSYLVVQAKLADVLEEKVCDAQWFRDGQPIESFHNPQFLAADDAMSNCITEFDWKPDMATSVTIGLQVSYENASTGETEKLYEEITVPIQNYSAEWYEQRSVDRILNLVSSTYEGNYTTDYAVKNDYQDFEKEIFVNAKGYSSKTGYLVWINRAYQHVNVFTGKQGSWKLVRSCLVGTGAKATPTPVGVTTIGYKSAAGWNAKTYTCKPVVGFYSAASGYAFHSRLYYPGTKKLSDARIGYPLSHGCIRMYEDDIAYLYDQVPIGSTVVIF